MGGWINLPTFGYRERLRRVSFAKPSAKERGGSYYEDCIHDWRSG